MAGETSIKRQRFTSHDPSLKRRDKGVRMGGMQKGCKCCRAKALCDRASRTGNEESFGWERCLWFGRGMWRENL